MSVKCQVVIDAMEKLAPKYLAENWDNVGLLLGNPAQPVSKILIALDLTLEIAKQAVDQDVDLIITHHPVIFKGIQRIRTDLPQGKLLSLLMKADIAVYSAHTNLDIAESGVNDVLSDLLSLENTEPLTVTSAEKLCKLVVFVPQSYIEEVRDALAKAGAGKIGEYSHCTFFTTGTGTFFPATGTTPFVGEVGKLQQVEEVRLEMIFAEAILRRVVKALLKAHPYEEVAYDIYPLQNQGKMFGLGRIGELSSSQSLQDFAMWVKVQLNVPSLRIVGNPNMVISKVAVCGGSGAGLIGKAAFSGADVMVTGDVKYHEAQDALATGIAVIDAGHFATEYPLVKYLQDYLESYNMKDKWKVHIVVAQEEKDVFVSM